MPLKNNKILIIEDESTLLMVLADKFRREGFVVYEAKDGLDGLKNAIKNKPNIILLDIIMPSMDGLTMLKKLREDKWGNLVPVIILSNLGDPDQVDEVTSNGGVVDYLVKSNWSLDDVVAKVKDTLSKV